MPTPAPGQQEISPAVLGFELQPEFHEIPLGIGADDEVFDGQLRAFARDYWGDQDDREPLRRLSAAMYSANSELLLAGGAVYNALGVFPIEDGRKDSEADSRISRCTLLISFRNLDNPDSRISAAGIAETLDRGSDDGEVQQIHLPAGPAVVHITGTRAVWELPEGTQEKFFVRIELWLPVPDEDRVLLISLSTADVQDLYFYQAVLADIADTIDFGNVKTNVSVAGPRQPYPFG